MAATGPLAEHPAARPRLCLGDTDFRTGEVVTIAADGSSTVTISNPTVPIFGQVSVTKELSGETQGSLAGATFDVAVSCPGLPRPGLHADGAAPPVPTRDMPVGTTCSVSEAAPAGGLLDSSYAWGTPVVGASRRRSPPPARSPPRR